jgi:hypothetical protein
MRFASLQLFGFIGVLALVSAMGVLGPLLKLGVTRQWPSWLFAVLPFLAVVVAAIYLLGVILVMDILRRSFCRASREEGVHAASARCDRLFTLMHTLCLFTAPVVLYVIGEVVCKLLL